MTRKQNLYACAAERRFLMLVANRGQDIEEWGRFVDLLYKEEWSEAASLCESLGFTDDSEKILEWSLTG